jgi:hypothetical protein
MPNEEKPLSARDRLLTALQSAPRLSREDAEAINAIVREAREASLADELPHFHRIPDLPLAHDAIELQRRLCANTICRRKRNGS